MYDYIPFIEEEEEEEEETELPLSVPKKRKYRKVRRKIPQPEYSLSSFAVPGVVKLVLSLDVQRLLICVTGADVTAESPWKYVQKELITGNLEHYEEKSEFCKIKQQVLTFPKEDILIIYLPDESRENDEFYFCLTIDSEEKAIILINKIKTERKERLNNTTMKTIKPWHTLGSSREVVAMMNKNTRPLVEMQVETDYPIMKMPTQFKLRLVEHARDGYAAVLPGRALFTNLTRRMMDVSVQATPKIATIASQTTYMYPKNVTTQYDYTYLIPKYTKQFICNLKTFAQITMGSFDDSIYVNSYINFYTSDYRSLIKSRAFTYKRSPIELTEYSSFYNHTLGPDKSIAAVAWHPMWTGVVAIGYSNQSTSVYKTIKRTIDEVLVTTFDVTPVLLWSFADTLTPRLFLETPRDIAALSFCPYDENILVGGCINGQVVIWDLTNRLHQVEEEEILTAEQQHYRSRMQSLMLWMRNMDDLKFVRTTVVSELCYSHIDAITTITWVSPYKEISKSGKVKEIPKNEERTSLQFTTTSLDGTIQCWDLRAKLSGGGSKSERKLRRLKVRPAALTTDVSPLRTLNRVFKPIFKVNVLAPHTARNLPILVVGRPKLSIQYVEKYPHLNQTYNIANRVYYKPDLKDSNIPDNKYVLGSAEGDLFVASWEGFEYNSGEIVNKETSEISSFTKFHDGPVVSLEISPTHDNLVLTAGGKLFALWLLDFPSKPVVWRKCKYRYTHGSWGSFRPSVFRLCRSDGYVEIWNLTIRSDRFQVAELQSGKTILGSYGHPLPLQRNVMGISDYTGAFRLFYVSFNTSEINDDEMGMFYNMILKEVDRKQSLVKWNVHWNSKNACLLAMGRAKILAAEKQKLEEKDMQPATQDVKTVEETKKMPQEMLSSDAEWRTREVQRMNAIMLAKKGLDINELEKQQISLSKLKKDKASKEAKLKVRLGKASKIFEDAATSLFADAFEIKSPPPPDLYVSDDYLHRKSSYFNNYRQIENTYGEFVTKNSYMYNFNWVNILKSGKKRRLLLDGYYERYSHKSRFANYKIRKEEEQEKAARWVPPPKVRGSSESLDDFDI